MSDKKSTTGRATATVRCGAVQQISDWRDPEGSLAKALAFCDRAARRGVKILCFPECVLSGSFDWPKTAAAQGKLHAEPIPGPAVDAFAAKARETDMYIIAGMLERPRRSRKLYNSAFVVGPREGCIGRHRKVFSEFEPGDEANVFPTRYGPIGIFICADMRSPELARLLALKGAKILFQPTCYFHGELSDRRVIRRRYLGKIAAQRSRAMENGLPLVIANGGQRHYVNNTRIIGPEGQGPEEVLARATGREQLVVADVTCDSAGSKARMLARHRPWLFEELARAAKRARRAPQ